MTLLRSHRCLGTELGSKFQSVGTFDGDTRYPTVCFVSSPSCDLQPSSSSSAWVEEGPLLLNNDLFFSQATPGPPEPRNSEHCGYSCCGLSESRKGLHFCLWISSEHSAAFGSCSGHKEKSGAYSSAHDCPPLGQKSSLPQPWLSPSGPERNQASFRYELE